MGSAPSTSKEKYISPEAAKKPSVMSQKDTNDVSPPLVGRRSSKSYTAGTPLPPVKLQRETAWNPHKFSLDLDRSAKKAGNGIGLVLQGRELPVMKSIDQSARQLREYAPSEQLKKTPYLVPHPGIKFAIKDGLEARKETRELDEQEEQEQTRRKRAIKTLLKNRDSSGVALPSPRHLAMFDMKDREVTFQEYIDVRGKFRDHRSAYLTNLRRKRVNDAVTLWRNSLSDYHYRVPSRLLRRSYKNTFNTYSLAPRYLPKPGELAQYGV